jgi:hypothetical protein
MTTEFESIELMRTRINAKGGAAEDQALVEAEVARDFRDLQTWKRGKARCWLIQGKRR